jgi:hypothetical protein
MEVVVKATAAVFVIALISSAVACAPEPPCDLRLCDIRERDCQRTVGRSAACLRGQAPADVPIRVMSQEQFLAESVAAGEGNVDTVLFARWMAGLTLLGLASPDVSVAEASRESAAWVAAFYNPGDRSITIIDRGRPLDSRGAVTLLVHEYTHALQDLSVGLQTFRTRLADDLDRLLASRAVTEGEATLIEDLAAVGLFGESEKRVPWTDVFSNYQQRARQAALLTKLPVDQSLGHFPYPFGLPYVHGAFRSGGFAAVERLYTEPPVSSAQVLAGFSAAGAGPWAEELGSDSVPLLPPRFSLIDTDRFGAWMLEVFVDRLLARSPPSAGLGQARSELDGVGRALRADRLSILRDGETDQTFACWRLRLSTASIAETLARHLRDRGPWVVWTRDRDVVLLASGDAEVRKLGTPDLAFGPLPERPMSASGSAAGVFGDRKTVVGCTSPASGR